MKFLRGKYFSFVMLSVAFICVMNVLRPIADPDFWWHLKTGEEMFRTGGLLAMDPFNFTSTEVLSARERIILHGYWVWQVGYYAAYALAGLWGVLALNVLLALAIFGTLAWLLARLEIDESLRALLLSLSMGMFLTYYRLERPQIFSFLFCLLLVALLDRFRDQRRLSPWLFPLMLLWGNVHGGVIIGCGLLGIFLAGVCIQLRADRQLVLRCALWAAGGILCGLLNPAGIYIAPELLRFIAGRQVMFSGVVEYISTPQLLQEGHYWVVCLWILMILHAIGLALSKRRWLADIFFFAVLLPAAFWYGRNMAFFGVCLLPQTAYYLKGMELSGRKWVRRVAWAGCTGLLGMLLLHGVRTQDFAAVGQVSTFYPVRLVEFIRQAGISGNAFNDYDWGGYLLWSLYPGTRLFWDGRCLDEKVYDQARRIRWTSPLPVGGRAEYEYLLEKYGVEYIIQKNISKIGLTEPLMRNLLKSEEWVPVYQDELGYVIVKNLGKYREIIERYRIQKPVFMQSILALYQRNIDSGGDPSLYMGRGELYLSLNNLEAARRDLLIARRFLGEDAYLEQLLNKAGL